MIVVTENIQLADDELEFQFIRASGPGGQNVNKTSTAVQLRFDVEQSPSLPAWVKSNLAKLAGKRLSQTGVLIIDARQYRTQERNRQDAIERLVELIRRATHRPKRRIKTKVPKAVKEKRLADKRRRSQTKLARRRGDNEG